MVNVVDVTGGQRGYGGGYPQQYARPSGTNVQIAGGAQDMNAMLQMLLEQQAMQQRGEQFNISQANMMTMMREQQEGQMAQLKAMYEAQAAEGEATRGADWRRYELADKTRRTEIESMFNTAKAEREANSKAIADQLEEQTAARIAGNALARDQFHYNTMLGLGQLGMGLADMVDRRAARDKESRLGQHTHHLAVLDSKQKTAQDRLDTQWVQDFAGVKEDLEALKQAVHLATSSEKSWDESYSYYKTALMEAKGIVEKWNSGTNWQRAMLKDARVTRFIKDLANEAANLKSSSGWFSSDTGEQRGVRLAAEFDRILEGAKKPISVEDYNKARYVGKAPDHAATNAAIEEVYAQQDTSGMLGILKNFIPDRQTLLSMLGTPQQTGKDIVRKPVTREDAREELNMTDPRTLGLKVMDNMVNGPSPVQKVSDGNGKVSAVTDMTTPTVPVVSPMYDELFN